ncbi:MAG: site-specific recombinase [Chitinophagaceae bacterium]|nr:site-specific recombinase [Chitinophagaceae bacterium]
MIWAFNKLAEGVFNTEDIFMQAKAKGFKRNKCAFWDCIRNPVYCGMIFIPAFKDEQSIIVQGLHEPIISTSLFYKVQDVLNCRSRIYKPRQTGDPNLPLRGFLECPDYGLKLSGSASTGFTKRVHYYHCRGGCKFRINAQKANELFLNELKDLVPVKAYSELYKEILYDVYKQNTKSADDEIKTVTIQINAVNDRLNKARTLLMEGKIDPGDYRIMKSDCEEKLKVLETKLLAITPGEQNSNAKQFVERAVDTLSHLDKLYINGDICTKREIISSILAQKIIFDRKKCRTINFTQPIAVICSLGQCFSELKKPEKSDFSGLYGREAPRPLALTNMFPALRVCC